MSARSIRKRTHPRYTSVLQLSKRTHPRYISVLQLSKCELPYLCTVCIQPLVGLHRPAHLFSPFDLPLPALFPLLSLFLHLFLCLCITPALHAARAQWVLCKHRMMARCDTQGDEPGSSEGGPRSGQHLPHSCDNPFNCSLPKPQQHLAMCIDALLMWYQPWPLVHLSFRPSGLQHASSQQKPFIKPLMNTLSSTDVSVWQALKQGDPCSTMLKAMPK